MLDRETALCNLRWMTAKVSSAGARFRPHFKTHQSAQIGEWFRGVGVEAITVSSVDMAEYFADYGWQDILIAFSLNPRQIERIRALAGRVRLGLLVENETGVQTLEQLFPEKADVWIKIDAGAHRTGLPYHVVAEIRSLIQAIRRQPNLYFRGLLSHFGNTYHLSSPEEVVRVFREGIDRLNELRGKLRLEFGEFELSVGDTPGCSLCDDLSGVDELRPWNFLFYDTQQLLIGSCRPDQIAVAVACPVVAVHPERNEAVLYGGAIHLSKDWIDLKGELSFGLAALPDGNRWAKPLDNAVVRSLSQEHGVVQFKNGIPEGLLPGGLLFILPAHSCLTVQELRKYLTLEGEVIHTMNG